MVMEFQEENYNIFWHLQALLGVAYDIIRKCEGERRHAEKGPCRIRTCARCQPLTCELNLNISDDLSGSVRQAVRGVQPGAAAEAGYPPGSGSHVQPRPLHGAPVLLAPPALPGRQPQTGAGGTAAGDGTQDTVNTWDSLFVHKCCVKKNLCFNRFYLMY